MSRSSFTVKLRLDDIKLIDRYGKYTKTTRSELIESLITEASISELIIKNYLCPTASLFNLYMTRYPTKYSRAKKKNFTVCMSDECIKEIELCCEYCGVSLSFYFEIIVLVLHLSESQLFLGDKSKVRLPQVTI